MTDGHGLPLSIATAGANVHDVKLLEETLINAALPPFGVDYAMNVCLDGGYVGYAQLCEKHGFVPHIRPRGEERKLIEIDPSFKPRRWVVEVCHSWVNRFRKLLIRFEKKDCNYKGLLMFAFAIIVWRKLVIVHR